MIERTPDIAPTRGRRKLSGMVEDVRALRSAAERAFAAGRHQQALAHSIRLERAEPEEPSWPRYTALVCQAMGRTLDQIDALERAARLYAKRGEPLKAAASCKHILALDADHASARKLLIGLRVLHGRGPARPPVAPSPRVSDRSWAAREGSGIRALPLREVVPGARPVTGARPRRGVHAIPVHGSDPTLTPPADRGGARAPTPPRGAAPGRPTSPPPLQAPEDRAVEAVEEALRAVARTERALIETTLFRDMPEAAFHDLIDRARLVRVGRERLIFRQGDRGETLYVIAGGEVGVIDEGPPRRAVSRLGEGDFFGEMALLGGAPRNATCMALADTELIALDHEVMAGVLREHPEVLTILLRFFRDRSVDRALATGPLFSGLSPRDKALVRPHFRFLEVEPGAELISQGERPDGLLMVLGGRTEVVRTGPGGAERLGSIGPGEMVGEASILEDGPAPASVRAVDKVFAMEFPAAAFRKLLASRPDVRAYVEQVVSRRRGELRSARPPG